MRPGNGPGKHPSVAYAGIAGLMSPMSARRHDSELLLILDPHDSMADQHITVLKVTVRDA
jgi:hypothetical protein